MVNDFEVIHMGGRTYNPHLGRFMQADPFVQAPGNLQNYNRYSYVLNNPMSYTDPSGYIFKKINKALGKFAPVFGIALMFIPGMQAWAAQSLLHAAATGFLVGGVSTGSLRGAMVGALTGAAFHQIGSHFGSKFGDFSSATLGQQAQWAGSHALAGGISSSLSGGKFGHGFFSAGFTKFAMGNAGFDYSNQSSPAVAGRVAIAAIIGGTASVISGGKFKNGATTAAMAQLLNAETENKRKLTEQSLADNKETLDRVLAARMRNATTDARNMLLKLTPDELRILFMGQGYEGISSGDLVVSQEHGLMQLRELALQFMQEDFFTADTAIIINGTPQGAAGMVAKLLGPTAVARFQPLSISLEWQCSMSCNIKSVHFSDKNFKKTINL